jgi:hypothetical protein
MDRYDPNQGAVPESAVVPSPDAAGQASPQPTATPQGAPPQGFTPGGPDTSSQPLPDAGAQPAPTQQPGESQVDWQARAQQAEAQQARIMQAIEQQAREAQRNQVEAAARSEAEQRRNMAYAQAQQMDPDQGAMFIRRFEDQERAQFDQRLQQTRQQSEFEKQQVVMQLAAPMYAEHLGQTHQLPPDLVQQLKAVPPAQMDAMVPILLTARDTRRQQQQWTQQQQASQQVSQMQQSGAYSVGGVGAPGGSPPSNQPRPTNRRARDAQDYAAALGNRQR